MKRLGSFTICIRTICLVFFMLIVTGAVQNSDAMIVQPAIDIAGEWNSNIGRIYQISQNGNKFSWTVNGVIEVGNGTITGSAIAATWYAEPGAAPASAKGTITVNAQGQAIKINWNNGVIFTRMPTQPGDKAKESTSPPADLKFEAKKIEPKRKSPHPEVDSKMSAKINKPKIAWSDAVIPSMHFVTDFKVKQKSARWAVLEVHYNYNPPTSPPVELGAAVYSKGIKVGEAYKYLPIELSSNGIVDLPIQVNWLLGTGSGHGNETDEIEFRIIEAGNIANAVKTIAPFKHTWGDDFVQLLGAYYYLTPEKDYQLAFNFWASMDYIYMQLSENLVAIKLRVIPFFQGKGIELSSEQEQKLEITLLNWYMGPPGVGSDVEKLVGYRTKNPQCDEIKVSMLAILTDSKYEIWKGSFPVSLKKK